MTRKEVSVLMEMVQKAYPKFYQNMPPNELAKSLNVWEEIFTCEDAKLVTTAVKNLVTTLELPPTIADVRREMRKLSSTIKREPLAIEEWNLIKGALGSSNYNAEAVFKSLPEAAQRFIGSPKQLREWSENPELDEETIRNQFLKQHDVLNERKEYAEKLERNPRLQAVLSKIFEKQNKKTQRSNQ